MLRDAANRVHVPVAADEVVRIVCLVPSLTELLCDLGLHEVLVGRTGFCIHPRALVQTIAKVGGTKDVDLAKVRALRPTHLVVNIDENRAPLVAELAQAIPHVIVTHPQAPSDNLALYHLFGTIFAALPGVAARARALASAFEEAHAALLAQTRARPTLPRRVLYCIWQDPWMSVAPQTYIGQMLALIDCRQVVLPLPLPLQPQPQPQPAPPRYPVFEWNEAVLSTLDLILLSSEPYAFGAPHVTRLQQQTGKPVLLVDGEMLSWYGSRAIAGLDYLRWLHSTISTGQETAIDARLPGATGTSLEADLKPRTASAAANAGPAQ